MTNQDKQTIYNLLRTASQNVYGYTTQAFQSEEYTPSPAAAPEYAAAPQSNVSPFQSAPAGFQTPGQAIQNAPAASRPMEQAPVQPAPLQTVQSAQVQPVQTQNNPPVQAQGSAEQSPASAVGMTLGDVILKITRCTRCSLARTRVNVVPGQGPKSAEVLVVGDGPVSNDDASGIPFSGPAGQLMDKMLNAIHLDRRQNCFLTNIVKCTPPQNRDPYPEETEACSGFLEAQIKIINPKMILCAGRVAAVSLLKNNQNVNLSLPVDQLRGQWYDYNGIPVMVVYNPAEVLRNPALKKPIWDDLRAFAGKLKELSPAYAALFNS